MANSNTPLATCDYWNRFIHDDVPNEQMVRISIRELRWLVNDARHLNELNSRAIECNYEDAAAMMAACLDYEK